MPFTPHWLLSYGGTMGTAGEIWSNNIRFHSAADLDADPDPQAWMAAAEPKIESMLGGVSSRTPNYTKLTYLKFNKIGADGRYVSNTESNTRFLTAPFAQGQNGTPLHPFSVAVCVTWTTEFQRGRGSKGRLFTPGAAVDITAEGQIATIHRDAICDAYASMLGALNGINVVPGDALRAVVASGINGALNPITGCSVGSVPDTMRSRRNQLVESRISQAVSGP